MSRSRYDSYSSYSRYPEYISVAERKAKAYKTAEKMGKADLSPVVISGRKISNTFWGKAWCDNVESYQDYSNRLPRGRSYVRSGSVIDLKITKGSVTALVCGSGRTPYKIDITIKPLEATRWDVLKKQCIGKIDSLVSLVQGKLSKDTLALFCDPDTGLFPESLEIKMKCSCPDSAGLCKHLAATLYGIGARLDTDPKLFFTLRGIDENELINADVVGALTEGVTSEIDDDALSAIFGVDFDTLNTPASVDAASSPRTKPTAKTKPTPRAKSVSKGKQPSSKLEGETVASRTTKVKPPAKRTAKTKPPSSKLEGETVASRTTKVKQPTVKPVAKNRKATPSKVDAASPPRTKPSSTSQSVIPAGAKPTAKRVTKG